jgi:hypothetical protein
VTAGTTPSDRGSTWPVHQSYGDEINLLSRALYEMKECDATPTWAESQYDRLPWMAADLVRGQVTVIAATTTPAALAAKAATATIPIVFETAGDPIRLGLVASLNRPGRNVTGVTQLSSELVSKRLGLLHDLIPTATIIGLLLNPTDPRAETQTRDMQVGRSQAKQSDFVLCRRAPRQPARLRSMPAERAVPSMGP